ncbi:unnamed protein product [Anisakis simplex]|uniref:Uncharacterized protein n=1 Tax=Anisakis simplex TaxID=6269 RepID=A0A0M3IZC7_ANISI|nr:unnamed protein product [Anisakis simplex]
MVVGEDRQQLVGAALHREALVAHPQVDRQHETGKLTMKKECL